MGNLLPPLVRRAAAGGVLQRHLPRRRGPHPDHRPRRHPQGRRQRPRPHPPLLPRLLRQGV
uniref:Uncharacterized protein n=1 Tax=Arundo donax TaxID=35708 RepID=A0A0A9HFL4_ARUDO